MNVYPPEISKYLIHPKNAGKFAEANAIAVSASFVCGSALRWTLQIVDKQMVTAKFQTNGCGYLMAAAEILAEFILNKSLGELHGLEGIEKQIEAKLVEIPQTRQHCVQLAIETLQMAFNDFRTAQIEEFIGEKALICTCFGVSEETIEIIIKENYCQTIEEVSGKCNAGSGCGSCQPLIQEIIDSNAFQSLI